MGRESGCLGLGYQEADLRIGFGQDLEGPWWIFDQTSSIQGIVLRGTHGIVAESSRGRRRGSPGMRRRTLTNGGNHWEITDKGVLRMMWSEVIGVTSELRSIPQGLWHCSSPRIALTRNLLTPGAWIPF